MFCVPASAPGSRGRALRSHFAAPDRRRVLRGRVEVDGRARWARSAPASTLALATLGALSHVSVAAAANGFARRALRRVPIAHLKSPANSSASRCRIASRAWASIWPRWTCGLRAAELLVDEAAAASSTRRARGPSKWRAPSSSPPRTRRTSATAPCSTSAAWASSAAAPSSALWRDVRALRIYEGASEVQKLILAKELFRRT
jgi:acyl-CoA dehydrogenase